MLDPESNIALEHLEKYFTAIFSKMGIKHNFVGQIYAFKQMDQDTICNYMSWLK